MYEQDEMRQVIMNIRDAARYMDPAYRIFTAAGIVLVQFLARMMKEHKISRSQFKDIRHGAVTGGNAVPGYQICGSAGSEQR